MAGHVAAPIPGLRFEGGRPRIALREASGIGSLRAFRNSRVSDRFTRDAFLILWAHHWASLSRSVQEILEIRPLTFHRTSDIIAGLVIVGAWLVTFLFLAHR